MKKIINYYYKIDLNSYDFFVQIFNNISKIKEEDLLTNFETQMKELNIAQNKIVMITNNKNNVNEYKSYRNSLNNSKKKNKEEINLRNSLDCMKNLKVGVYHRFYISPIKKEKIKVIENNNLLIQIPYIKTPSTKKYTLVLDLNKTLAFFDTKSKRISLRNGLFSFLSILKPYYELISFSCEINEKIIREIELQKKYFDYLLNDEYSISYNNTLVKPISCLGRDIFRIIIIDDDEKSFQLTKENGIKISEYNGNNKFDSSLYEFEHILILIYQSKKL